MLLKCRGLPGLQTSDYHISSYRKRDRHFQRLRIKVSVSNDSLFVNNDCILNQPLKRELADLLPVKIAQGFILNFRLYRVVRGIDLNLNCNCKGARVVDPTYTFVLTCTVLVHICLIILNAQYWL